MYLVGRGDNVYIEETKMEGSIMYTCKLFVKEANLRTGDPKNSIFHFLFKISKRSVIF